MLERVAHNRCFGGEQNVYAHDSAQLGCRMRFAVYLPPQAAERSVPVFLWLSGLTCTEENFPTKAGAQRVAAELGIALVAPDTSPRGDDVPDDPEGSYDFGLGAGFYVDASQPPWSTHYRMRSYIDSELPALLGELPLDPDRLSICGHSMGGHGALTIGLRNPGRFRAVSAFAPICSPMRCPWGQKALAGYLGQRPSVWRQHDACALIEDGARLPELLVDQGEADQFLDQQLKPELLAKACRDAGIDLDLRLQPGYDHSYYFIASFIEDHLRWHADRLYR